MTEPKVLIVAAEGAPFAKTGGLADVIGALPKALRELGAQVAVMMPKHASVKAKYQDRLDMLATMTVNIGWRHQYVGLETMTLDGVRYYFIDNEYYFGGPVYKGGDAECEQYLYFCRAVLEALPYTGFEPDVIHANDWHTGMIPMLVKTQYQGRPQGGIKTVFTIHNLQYQGQTGFDMVRDMLGVDPQYFTAAYLEAYGCANIMKAALVFADKITTVSPTYAREILYPYYGRGMEGVLTARKGDLSGIVNGIDTVEFDPESDQNIAKRYSAETLEDKRMDKKAIQTKFGLEGGAAVPLLGMVTRMTEQKGLDLVRAVLEEMLNEGYGFVILGSGDVEYHDYFNYIAGKYPGKAGVFIGYNDELAHKIYAGVDFFLMPSQFEPCGMSQMIAQRYGTLPIVRETGGLADTVTPYNQYTGEGDGFSFANYNAHEMMGAVREAGKVFKTKPVMRVLMKQAMAKDNSFLKSAAEYLKVYNAAIGGG